MAGQDIPNDPNRSVLDLMNDDTVGVVWDRGEPNSVQGLHLRTFASGKKCFYFLYRIRSAVVYRRPKIAEGVSLTEARKIARHLAAQVAMGIDPKGQWDMARNEHSVETAYEIIFKEYWSTPRFQKSGRAREVANIWSSQLLPSFGKRKLSDVKNVEVRMWHQCRSETPIMANRALEILSTIYKQSISREWTSRNPCLGTTAFSERKRKRVPTKEELTNIVRALQAAAVDSKDDNNLAAIYILALFYTGARPQMVTDVRWEHIKREDERGAHVELSGKMSYKFNDDETMFIPKQIMDMVNLYPRNPNGRIFSGGKTRQLWTSMMQNFSINDLWKRDARRAFASIALNSGVPIDQVGNALNHKSATTTKTYAREFDNNNAKVTTVVASEIDKLLEGEI